jgi:serine protease
MTSFKKNGILLIVLILFVGTMLVSISCNPDIEYSLSVEYYPNERSKEWTPKPSKTVSPDKFEVMKEHIGDFDRIIVKFKDKYDVNSIDTRNPDNAKFEKYGEFIPKSKTGSVLNFAVVKPDLTNRAPTDINWEEIIKYYDSLPEVEYAEPDYKIHLCAVTPDDPRYPEQWHLQQLNMEEAWEISMGIPSVKVAVIDTGVCYTDDPDETQDNGLAPDLSEVNFDTENAWDYINDDNIAYDDGSHGTHVTGTIAQTTNNGVGCAGMAPNVTILPIKVIAGDGSGGTGDYNSNLASGIERAADAGAHVINMSLRSDGYSSLVNNACQYAYQNGTTVFAASGNGVWGVAQDEVEFPAGHEHVIAVGATDNSKIKTSYSNYGLGNGSTNFGLDIVAPGGDTSGGDSGGVLQNTIGGYDYYSGTTDWNFNYYWYQGTSMATPHAVGLAALMYSVNPFTNPDEIETVLKDTAEDLGDSGVDELYAYGLINPVDALNEMKDLAPETTTDTLSGTVTEDDASTHTINSLGSYIKIDCSQLKEGLLVELIDIDGSTVLDTSTGELIDYSIGDNPGEYTIRVSVQPQ